ncbi:hypothetical protein PsorP6_009596 [Peronosclerospora sorghi]|uniref:Uncharacterized protein n=1 Tax=Peronosclerospora sorghi TaxID=230839 RepID=A0ACC0W0G6_9STRA|nr:hypothetical protein PsorP6_009596 [Peronosclerospora sorghi]
MFRTNWDLVSPYSWLESLAYEEEFMGGLDARYTPTQILFLSRPRPVEGEDESMKDTNTPEEEEEEMESEESPTVDEKQLMTGDFFDDLPVGAKVLETQVPPNLSPPTSKTKDGYSFFTYAYSTCLTADDNGRRVSSTRRRYEDSGGRLKAQHKRKIGACELDSTWKRTSEQDEGTFERKISSGSVEGFEEAWKSTPFGAAEEHAKGHVLPDQPPPQEIP